MRTAHVLGLECFRARVAGACLVLYRRKASKLLCGLGQTQDVQQSCPSRLPASPGSSPRTIGQGSALGSFTDGPRSQTANEVKKAWSPVTKRQTTRLKIARGTRIDVSPKRQAGRTWRDARHRGSLGRCRPQSTARYQGRPPLRDDQGRSRAVPARTRRSSSPPRVAGRHSAAGAVGGRLADPQKVKQGTAQLFPCRV